MSKQQKEIETIKPRKYMLKLSDADVERLAKRAGKYNMTSTELLENFIGDLIGGTYSNGSDERDLADRWSERCWFSHEHDKNLITFLCGGSLWHDIDELIERIENINDAKSDVKYALEKIKNPDDEWKHLVYCKYNDDRTSYEYVQRYNSLEEYIADFENDLADYQENLAFEEEQFEKLKKEFAEYMGNISYTWEAELETFLKWHKSSMPEAEEEAE